MPWWGSTKPKLLEAAEFSIIEEITIRPQEIGRGSYGTVYAAEYNGKPCVAKEMHPHLSHHQKSGQNIHTPLETFFKEINTLSSLKHPSIVQFLGVYFRDGSHVPILVMERMWINLYDLLEKRPHQLPLLIKTHILYDVACGLQYLHGQKKPVVHRDLNANNILLTENLNAKIADLGQAKALHKIVGQKLSTAPGNVSHMAPETLKHKPTYDNKLDIFSFGCTIIHLVTEEFPTPSDQFVSLGLGDSFKKVMEVDRRKRYIDKMDSYTLLKQVALQCLLDEPSCRPDVTLVCAQLTTYIKTLETESPDSAQQYKNDKLSLLQSFQSQADQLERKSKLLNELNKERSIKEESLIKKEDYIATLELKLEDTQKKIENSEMTILTFTRESESLQKKLTDKDKESKQVTETYQNQVDRLRKDLDVKQDEAKAADIKCTSLQQSVKELQTKFDNSLIVEKQKVSNLEEELQRVNSLVNQQKQELAIIKESLAKEKEQDLSNLSDHYKQDLATIKENLANKKDRELLELQTKLKAEYDEAFAEKCAGNEEIVMQLRKKLEEKECQLNEAVKSLQDGKSKNSQPLQMKNKVTDPGSKLHQWLLELQHVNETKHEQLHQQQLSYAKTFMLQDAKVSTAEAKMADLRKKFIVQKQQLEEKSYRLSMLESSNNELQQFLYAKEEKLKSLENDNATLTKLVDNNDKLQRNLEKNLKSKEESLERKDKELQLQKKEHADELNKLHAKYGREIEDICKDKNMYKVQMSSQGGISKLLEEETQFMSELAKNNSEKIEQQEIEIKNLLKQQKDFKQLIKHQESNFKEKTKYIKELEKKKLDVCTSRFHLNITWYPYMSLPVSRIRPSAVIIKGKAFIAGGYNDIDPQGEDFSFYLKSFKDNMGVLCFHTGKCRCESIASPVVLGGVASVNGQCVLVSGAEGNTLTGNVYVLCEEGSDEQWKKFSEPVPTPRILPCVCCYSEKWLIVCGGYACKEGSNLLEAVNVVEILDTNKGEWHALTGKQCPGMRTILCCTLIGENLYVVGNHKILNCNLNKLLTTITKKSENDMPLWSEIETQVDGIDKDTIHPFSVVDVNGEPMIIASISGSEDDVTCVLMKDTTDTWRKMSEAVECQHCSAVVVTPTLELLLFGGSEKVSMDIATDLSQKGILIPILNLNDAQSVQQEYKKEIVSQETLPSVAVQVDSFPLIVNQPPAVSFTGPIHTQQFDHKGGTFQSPVHKVSIVVPPNAIDDSEKVTVHMGATTSGPFDLPEDCKLRSAVVWLGSDSDVVLKRSIAVVVPHSAVFTSPQHHSMMRFLTCEDCEGPRYKFRYSLNHFEIDEEQGWMELTKFSLVAIAASPDYSLDGEGIQCSYEENAGSDDEEFHETHETFEDVQATGTPKIHSQRSSLQEKTLGMPPSRYLAILFWPRKHSCLFRADIYYLQNLYTELFKVETLYRQAYYEDNGSYPEIVVTEFMIDGDGTELKCVLPCSGSSKCDCLSGWEVTQMNDISEVLLEKAGLNYKIDPMKFSFTFNCCDPKQNLVCCFEFQGAEAIIKSSIMQVPDCLQKKYDIKHIPFIIEQMAHPDDTMGGNQVDAHHMATQEEEGPVNGSPHVKNLL